ncbi:MAG: peptidyl-tRNA hydrolase Pth2 [Candidatus Bathyarchaeota archaeon]|nr:peptidyl-tRNA hydrolase Pth2 [Candidatus Bathyarchaeota archaeon]MDH5495551.1 peptidyl-tRNA hydrolase Pth2 [Candidatus Bathyarchaeota archaeon]
MSQEEFKYKQVIAVRTDLKMSKGKLAAQVGHAAVSASEEAKKKHPEWWQAWLKEGQCKVAVKVKNLAELLELQKEASQMKLPYSLITDRGLTQLPPSTVTCLGIGPAPSIQIDKITGKLPLL